MKKELFDEFITILQNGSIKVIRSCKVVETEEFISYSFDITDQVSAAHHELCKTTFAQKGWKNTDDISKILNRHGACKEYYTVLYNKIRDSISIGIFRTGYSLADIKNRWYPIHQRIPIMCCSKHIYTFYHKNKPRILLGTYLPWSGGGFNQAFQKVFLKLNYYSNIRIPYRYFMGTKNEWEVLEKYFNMEIPTAIKESRIMEPEHLFNVLNEGLNGTNKKQRLTISINLKLNQNVCKTEIKQDEANRHIWLQDHQGGF